MRIDASRFPASSLGAVRARRARLRRRQLAAALVLGALSAAFWGALSGAAAAAGMTFVSLAGHAAWSVREGESLRMRAALSYLVGGTWAALELILRHRLPH